MNEYSPKRRTALVFTGSGTSGSYHAGVLKALEESGVKIDLVVGSGAGAIAAAYAAVDGGARLYGPGGFWERVRWRSLFRLRPAVLVVLGLLAASFVAFLLPAVLALLAGLLFPLVLIADRAAPGGPTRFMEGLGVGPESLSGPYLAALAAPIFALALFALVSGVVLAMRDRRRLAESFESFFDVRPGQERLRRGLWEIARGAALSSGPPSEAELGRRYVLKSLLCTLTSRQDLIARMRNEWRALGQLDHRNIVDVVNAGATSNGVPFYVMELLLGETLVTGLLPPVALPVRRVAFPKGGPFGGQTHRLTDATLLAGSGLSEALAAGAEQVIVVSGAPETATPAARRRGPWARLDATLSLLEGQALERDISEAERINRMVATLGHRVDDGSRGWQDPATGRLYRELALYVIRPPRRTLGPLEVGGARDPATEVVQTTADLLEQGYRDAGRLFVEPVVGGAPLPDREEAKVGGR